MNNPFKKLSIAVMAVLCLIMFFSIAAPAPIKAQGCDPGLSTCIDNPNYIPPQQSGNPSQINDFTGLSGRLASIGTIVLYLLVALAVIFIVWNVVRYFIGGKEGESRGPAGLNILWGLIGLFVIISLWGLVNILLNTFGTNQNITNKLPQADFVNK